MILDILQETERKPPGGGRTVGEVVNRMLGKQFYDEADDSCEMLDQEASQEREREIKKRIHKRKLVLECVLGFLIGILTGILPGETVTFLFISCLLLLVFLPFILLTD